MESRPLESVRNAPVGFRLVAYSALLAVVYFLAAKFGLAFAFSTEQVSVIWPASGIALASLILFGYRLWPGIAVGAFLANATASGLHWTAFAIAGGNTLEALAGAWMLRRFIRFDYSLSRVKDILGLILFSAMGSTALAATIGVTSLSMSGLFPWSAYYTNWWTWWFGDGMGILIAGSFLLSWTAFIEKPEKRVGEWTDYALLSLLCFLIGLLIFSPNTFWADLFPPSIIVFPIVIFAALKLGPPGASLAILVIRAIAAVAVVLQIEPFGEDVEDSLIGLQVYMCIVALTGMVLASANMERRLSKAALRATEEDMRYILQAAQVGTWDLDINAGILRWSERRDGAGRPIPNSPGVPFEDYLNAIHPEDRERVEEAVQRSLDEGALYHVEYRQVRKDGTSEWIECKGKAFLDSERTPKRMSGIYLDISARKELERKILEVNQSLEKRVAERTAALSMLHDVSTFANSASTFEEAFDYTLERFSRYNGFCYGHVFLVSDTDPDELVLTDSAYDESEGKFRTLLSISKERRLRKGEGLPGRVLASGSLEWTRDIPFALADRGIDTSKISNLTLAVCFPVVANGEIKGVLEFFANKEFEFGAPQLEVLATVGNHLGRVVERIRSDREIRRRESKFRAVFENRAVGIGILAPRDGLEILQANRTLARMLGYTPNDLLGRRLSDLTDASEDVEAETTQILELMNETKRSFHVERKFNDNRGNPVWTHVYFSLLKIEESTETYFLAFVEDITEQMEAELALAESEEMFRTLVESIQDYAIFMLDKEGNVVTWNAGAEKIKGYRGDEILGRHFSFFYTPEDAANGKPDIALKRAASEGKWVSEGWRVGKNNRRFMAHVVMTALYDEEGQVRGYAKITRDITERQKLEEMIANATLEEQRRIAGVLHDGVGQQLTGIRFIAASLAKKLTSSNSEGSKLAEQLSENISEALTEVRDLSRGIHPVEVDSEGLSNALKTLAEKTESIYGVPCTFHTNGGVTLEDNNTATQIYYIVREALNNEMKHGEPSQVQILLFGEEGKIELAIQSDGKGFDPKSVGNGGVGFRTMNYRASLIGAQFEIDSNPGAGTKIRCSLRPTPA